MELPQKQRVLSLAQLAEYSYSLCLNKAENQAYLLASNGNILYYHDNNIRLFIYPLSILSYLSFSER
jgi:hypothetical protein